MPSIEQAEAMRKNEERETEEDRTDEGGFAAFAPQNVPLAGDYDDPEMKR